MPHPEVEQIEPFKIWGLSHVALYSVSTNGQAIYVNASISSPRYVEFSEAVRLGAKKPIVELLDQGVRTLIAAYAELDGGLPAVSDPHEEIPMIEVGDADLPLMIQTALAS